MRCRGPAVIADDRPILSLERMLYKDYDRRSSIKGKNILAVSLKGPLRQDEMIGGKPSVVNNSERLKLGGGQTSD
jgi:hypothetical protein